MQSASLKQGNIRPRCIYREALMCKKTPQEALHALVVKQDENAKYNRHPRGLAQKTANYNFLLFCKTAC